MKYHKRGELVQGYTVKTHPLYNTWVLLKQRCQNPNSLAYKHYGGRGISICESWKQFKNFAEDMGMKPSSKHSLERIDNDGGYCPTNCKWATVEEQRLNRRCFKTSESGFTGIRKTTSGKFQAIIHLNKIRYNIGLFNTINEAVHARQKFIEARA